MMRKCYERRMLARLLWSLAIDEATGGEETRRRRRRR
jgi:hypothetical protein